MKKLRSKLESTVGNSSYVVDRSPFFYGWIVLAVGSLGLIMTSPGQSYAVSIFLEDFIGDLGLSRTLVSTLFTIATLAGSLALPFVGRQIDRRGSRWVTVVTAALLGLVCIFMGFVRGAVMLGLGFVALRLLGQGSLQVVSINVINQWWVRRRGTMMGISGLLMNLVGMGGFPILINWLIVTVGWRTAYPLLGVLVLVLMLPLAWIFLRDRPEDYGLQPDGDSPADAEAEAAELSEENWTSGEAMRTAAFWVILLGQVCISMFITALFFHMVSIFEDNGLAPAIAAAVFLPIGATTALANLGSGIVLDRISVRLILAAALFLQALGLLMALSLQGTAMAFVYGIILGVTKGLDHMVYSVAWADYFGRRHLGQIMGTSSTVRFAASAVGALPFAIARDLLGSYTLVLIVSAALPLVLGVICLFVRRPTKQGPERGRAAA